MPGLRQVCMACLAVAAMTAVAFLCAYLWMHH